jgi:hypothetical protein
LLLHPEIAEVKYRHLVSERRKAAAELDQHPFGAPRIERVDELGDARHVRPAMPRDSG